MNRYALSKNIIIENRNTNNTLASTFTIIQAFYCVYILLSSRVIVMPSHVEATAVRLESKQNIL